MPRPRPARGGVRAARHMAARRIAAHGLDFLELGEGAIVSGFSAIGDEIDPNRF